MSPALILRLMLFLMLPAMAVRAQPRQGTRLSSGLQRLLEGKAGKDSVDVLIQLTEKLPLDELRTIWQAGDVYLVRGTVAAVRAAFLGDRLVYAQELRVPKEELTTGGLDLSLNHLRLAHNRYPGWRGDSVLLSVKELRLDTSDIDIAGRWINTGVGAVQASSHAAVMTTAAAGAGNTSPFALGAAPRALVTSSDFATLLPEPLQVYQQYRISVQNHSYGTGIENFYGVDARAYDRTTVGLPYLLHVFSAGNSGTSASTSGLYANRPGIANLTGSFKQAKNILTVGATDSFDRVVPLSSRGPAYDGRVKPELVAFGEDGSSGAAALVSGTAALVQQALGRAPLPAAHLVKAVLINSADDLGLAGPDFVSGYGSLNAFQALRTVELGNYRTGTLQVGQPLQLSLSVPGGMRRVKLTLAWSDPEAAANAGKALVHDLDLKLTDPSGAFWFPWVLNPHPDSLHLPARRKKDSLNPVEQISLDLPAAGVYTIEVSAAQLGQPQPFALAWQIDTLNSFSWVYPSSGDPLLSGKEQLLRWHSERPGSGVLEASFDGGAWQPVQPVSDLAQGYARWMVPDRNALVQVRLRFPDGTAAESEVFVISRETALNVGFNCPDSLLLHWRPAGIPSYRIDTLGRQYLGAFRSLADTALVVQKDQHSAAIYAVTPLVNGRAGMRSFAIDYRKQGVGCYVRSFFASLGPDGRVSLQLELGTLYGLDTLGFEKLGPGGFTRLGSVLPTGLASTFIDPSPGRGSNTYRAFVRTSAGGLSYSDPQTVYYFPDLPVILYPNPVMQDQPLKIIAREPGLFTIRVYDLGGRKLDERLLDDIRQEYLTLQLSPGMYLVEVISASGRSGVQKLIVR